MIGGDPVIIDEQVAAAPDRPPGEPYRDGLAAGSAPIEEATEGECHGPVADARAATARRRAATIQTRSSCTPGAHYEEGRQSQARRPWWSPRRPERRSDDRLTVPGTGPVRGEPKREKDPFCWRPGVKRFATEGGLSYRSGISTA